jgi:hypothetical protein
VRAKWPVIGLIFGATYLIADTQSLRAADEAPTKPEPSATIIDGKAVRGILGRAVQGADGKEMGRVIDIVVDPTGKVRAAIIDFGGFLGVGSRKIAVDWSALHFGDAVKHDDDIGLGLTQDQLKDAPEYKEGNALVVIGSTGGLEPLDFPPSITPEK